MPRCLKFGAMSMRTVPPYIYVGAGGFLGAMLRYAMTLMLQGLHINIPYGTLVANTAGCLLIGVVVGLSEDIPFLSAEARLFLATGVCGGFTTLSSLIYELLQMVRVGHYLIASLYFFLTFSGAAIAFMAGVGVVRVFIRG
ncbi:MAG: fluoride efflux transporter CrcB [Chitinivibrionales bacterium]|nr:fluoride efflux transporter CrcB [Chitinivibrionales bacterium]